MLMGGSGPWLPDALAYCFSMMLTTTHLLYLHGFRSSPQSTKAQRFASLLANQHPGVNFWCPALPASPRLAMEGVWQGIANWPRERMAVIGSSLGGFYATAVAHRTGCRAVLINPAIDPARDLARHIGEHSFWHQPEEKFFFEAAFVDELRALECGALPHPERLLAVIAKGDELLDWREMSGRYPGSPQRIIEGSDHALSDLDQHLDAMLRFLQLA